MKPGFCGLCAWWLDSPGSKKVFNESLALGCNTCSVSHVNSVLSNGQILLQPSHCGSPLSSQLPALVPFLKKKILMSFRMLSFFKYGSLASRASAAQGQMPS